MSFTLNFCKSSALLSNKNLIEIGHVSTAFIFVRRVFISKPLL